MLYIATVEALYIQDTIGGQCEFRSFALVHVERLSSSWRFKKLGTSKIVYCFPIVERPLSEVLLYSYVCLTVICLLVSDDT